MNNERRSRRIKPWQALRVGAYGLLTALLPLIGASRAAAAVAERPNIVFVMPDDVGYGDYACLGNPIIRTPAANALDRKSTRLNSSHRTISYAVFCLKKKKKK